MPSSISRRNYEEKQVASETAVATEPNSLFLTAEGWAKKDDKQEVRSEILKEASDYRSCSAVVYRSASCYVTSAEEVKASKDEQPTSTSSTCKIIKVPQTWSRYKGEGRLLLLSTLV